MSAPAKQAPGHEPTHSGFSGKPGTWPTWRRLFPSINKVNQGLLPKDASQKLKRIEKLAKPLRSEMTPESLNLQGLRPDHLPTGGSP